MPNIIVTHISSKPEAKDLFVDWQSKLQSEIANFPGFLSLEILAPNKKHSTWTIVQRFEDAKYANAWKESKARKELFQDFDFLQEIEEKLCDEGNSKGATEVIITETHPDQRDFYGKWLAKIHQAEAKIQGFRGMYVQSPIGEQGKYWVTFLQFDSTENLDRWLTSFERKEILKELDPLIKSFESHRVISPFAGWFGSITSDGGIPAIWKQTMLILLVLFPIVMLQIKFLNPRLQDLNLSLSTFIGNAISVSLISWPMLPLVIFFFNWWLQKNDIKTNALGAFALIALYFFEILIFRSFT